MTTYYVVNTPDSVNPNIFLSLSSARTFRDTAASAALTAAQTKYGSVPGAVVSITDGLTNNDNRYVIVNTTTNISSSDDFALNLVRPLKESQVTLQTVSS